MLYIKSNSVKMFTVCLLFLSTVILIPLLITSLLINTEINIDSSEIFAENCRGRDLLKFCISNKIRKVYLGLLINFYDEFVVNGQLMCK